MRMLFARIEGHPIRRRFNAPDVQQTLSLTPVLVRPR
jgi:hypothetical protein